MVMKPSSLLVGSPHVYLSFLGAKPCLLIHPILNLTFVDYWTPTLYWLTSSTHHFCRLNHVKNPSIPGLKPMSSTFFPGSWWHLRLHPWRRLRWHRSRELHRHRGDGAGAQRPADADDGGDELHELPGAGLWRNEGNGGVGIDPTWTKQGPLIWWLDGWWFVDWEIRVFGYFMVSIIVDAWGSMSVRGLHHWPVLAQASPCGSSS